LIVDRLRVKKEENHLKRLIESIKTAIQYGEESILLIDSDTNELRYFSQKLVCPTSGISYSLPEPNSFSFNSPKGMCLNCKGLGIQFDVSRNKIIPDDTVSIEKGGIVPLGEKKSNWGFRQMEVIAKRYNFSLSDPLRKIPKEALEVILKGGNEKFSVASKALGITRDYKIDYEGIENFIKYQFHNTDAAGVKRWANGFMDEKKCSVCHGARLNQESLNFKIDNFNIADVSALDLGGLFKWFEGLADKLHQKELKVAEEIIKEIKVRLQFLLDVGLSYLSLNRSSKSLSGGEAQRIRLATQIGSQLVGVLYILDEPSIGLHQVDNNKLIKSLELLRDIGNSVIVVEHDKEMILRADHIIDIGPMAGKNGGEIISEGSPSMLKKQQTLTAQYLNDQKKIEIPVKRKKGNGKCIVLSGCTGNNLKNIEIYIPLGIMIGVTGVSGSGKSTLINETLYPILNAYIYNGVKQPLPYKKIEGIRYLDKVVDVNQSPIGRTPRSNPATYCGFFSEIRALFTMTPEAQIRGYKPGRFSFNVKGGRCETCQGAGMKLIEMNFLPDVQVECETCNGKRFNRETLEIRFKGKSIFDTLEMTVNQACDFFKSHPKIYRKLKTVKDVGLGYITLGQSSTTLSGGEAQRIKLATELSKKDTGKTLYILDEPTTGLHFEDVRVLMEVLDRLVKRGNTVLIIEHNMDVIKLVDHLIDIGPEGGKNGGTLIGQGTPEDIVKLKKSHTGRYLKKELKII